MPTPTRCSQCAKWIPANPDAVAGWCPVKQAMKWANAPACEAGSK